LVTIRPQLRAQALPARQLDAFAIDVQLASGNVDANLAESQLPAGVEVRAAYQRAAAGCELRLLERFDHEVVCAQIESLGCQRFAGREDHVRERMFELSWEFTCPSRTCVTPEI
jgi:hypothetical protein